MFEPWRDPNFATFASFCLKSVSVSLVVLLCVLYSGNTHLTLDCAEKPRLKKVRIAKSEEHLDNKAIKTPTCVARRLVISLHVMS